MTFIDWFILFSTLLSDFKRNKKSELFLGHEKYIIFFYKSKLKFLVETARATGLFGVFFFLHLLRYFSIKFGDWEFKTKQK